jgi:type III secretion protein L
MQFFKLPSGASYHSDEKIIESSQVGTFLKLEEMTQDFKKELELFKESLKQDELKALEEKKQEAYQEALTIFNQHILSIDAEIRSVKTQLLKQVLPLALNAAKKIVADQLRLFPETIVDIIKKQIDQCSSAKKIKVLVAKEDKEILEKKKQELKESLDQCESLSFEESPDLTQGSCMILTEAGNINATLDLQWKALEAAFERFKKNA